MTIAELPIKPTGKWTEISTNVSNAPTSMQDLIITQTGENPVAVDWISFE